VHMLADPPTGSEKTAPIGSAVALDRQVPPGERAVKVGATTTAQLVWILAARLPKSDGRGPDRRIAPIRR